MLHDSRSLALINCSDFPSLLKMSWAGRWQRAHARRHVTVLCCPTVPSVSKNILIYQNHHYVKATVCRPSALWYFLFICHSMKKILLAGPHAFVFLLFFDSVLLNKCIFILYCKDVLNCSRKDRCTVRCGRSLLNWRDSFLRTAVVFGCLYFYGTLLWTCRCFFLHNTVLRKVCLAHYCYYYYFINMHFSVSNCCRYVVLSEKMSWVRFKRAIMLVWGS